MSSPEAYKPVVDTDLVERITNNPMGIVILYKGPPISGIDMEADSKVRNNYMDQRAKLLEARGIGPLTLYNEIFCKNPTSLIKYNF